MRGSISNRQKILWKGAGILLFLVFWQILAMRIGDRRFLLPGPSETIRRVFEMARGAYLYRCIWGTLRRMLTGFLISWILGLLLGCIAGNSERFRLLLEPGITCLKAVPTASLVYLFIVLSGARNAPIYVVILISFPIIYESVCGGIAGVSPEILKALQLDGGDELSHTLRVKLPLALPYIAVGFASSFALSFKIEIMAEVITGYSKLGLGSAILASQRSDPTDMTDVFAYSLSAVLLVLLIDGLARILERKLRTVYP